MRSEHHQSPTFSTPSVLGVLTALLLIVAGACGGDGGDGDASQRPSADNSTDAKSAGSAGSGNPVTGTVTIDGEEHLFQFGGVEFSNFDTGTMYYAGRCNTLFGVRMMNGYAVDDDGEAIASDDGEPIGIELSVPGSDLDDALQDDDAAGLELDLHLGDANHRLLGEDDGVEPPTWAVDGGRVTGSATVSGGWKDGVEADPFPVTFDIADCD